MFLPANITLQFGDSGDFVAELQRRLAAIDAHPGDAINGFYDGVTVNSVSGFQSRSGIRADGIAGPETLRRLNGVASGDTSTSSSDNKTEEEEKQLANDQYMREQMLLNQEQAGMHAPVMAQQAVETAAAATVAAAAVEHYAQAVQPQTVDIQQQIAQQNREILHQQQMQQQPPQLSGDALAQMLMQQQQQQAAPSPLGREEQLARQAPLQPVPQPQQAAPEQQPEQQQQPKGIVGRAIAKMDAFVQRLAEHFEAKLPPHVLQQVHELGQVMARSGVRDAGIPSGPEMGAGIQTPGRGPEQQQGQLR